jgi:hypothetical protein
MLGNVQGKIDDLDSENARLQTQIIQLEQTVEENRYVDQAFLYELYREVPSVYNETQLVYNVNALLELAGITLNPEVLRTIEIDDEVTVPSASPIASIANQYKVVEITIFFTESDLSKIQDFIDVLAESNQFYLLNELYYSYPINDERVPIQISYYTFYANE